MNPGYWGILYIISLNRDWFLSLSSKFYINSLNIYCPKPLCVTALLWWSTLGVIFYFVGSAKNQPIDLIRVSSKFFGLICSTLLFVRSLWSDADRRAKHGLVCPEKNLCFEDDKESHILGIRQFNHQHVHSKINAQKPQHSRSILRGTTKPSLLFEFFANKTTLTILYNTDIKV